MAFVFGLQKVFISEKFSWHSVHPCIPVHQDAGWHSDVPGCVPDAWDAGMYRMSTDFFYWCLECILVHLDVNLHPDVLRSSAININKNLNFWNFWKWCQLFEAHYTLGLEVIYLVTFYHTKFTKTLLFFGTFQNHEAYSNSIFCRHQ